jgi:hypothetical protein
MKRVETSLTMKLTTPHLVGKKKKNPVSVNFALWELRIKAKHFQPLQRMAAHVSSDFSHIR